MTEDVLTVWVHHGKDRREERGLIRLAPDENQTNDEETGEVQSNDDQK